MAFGLFFTVVALVIAALVQFGLNYKPLSVFWMVRQDWFNSFFNEFLKEFFF
jgi:hypothetical protein